MIEDPDRWAPAFAEAGAHSVTFHAEAARAPIRLARQLRSMGVRVGLGLKPATPVEPYLDLLPEFDMVLVMTVEPGFGGQQFLDVCLPKVTKTRAAIASSGLDIWVQVDGGVSDETIGRCAEAGADVFVAGSAVYGAGNAADRIARLRALAAAAGGHAEAGVTDTTPKVRTRGDSDHPHEPSARPVTLGGRTSVAHQYDHPRPRLAADVVLLGVGPAGPEVLLVKRRIEPFAGWWALPGGHVRGG